MKHATVFTINKFICSFIILLMCSLTAAQAQAPDSKGTDYWIGFPGNYVGSSTLILFISGDEATSGTVTVPGNGFSENFTVTPGMITSIELPTGTQMLTSDAVQNLGIHVVAKKEVTIYGLNRRDASTDAFLALPTDILGTEYINLGYQNVNVYNATQLGIVGTVNNTKVNITPSVTTDGHAAGNTYTITLNQGQTYLLRNTGSASNDLSGTVITSNSPIAVFGGHGCANIPAGAVACDHIVEQLPPTSAWGKQFVTVPLATRLKGDTFRFVASVNSTQVKVNGVTVATLNKGEIHEQIIEGAAEIVASQPILVAQYSNSSSFDGVTSDPFMMLIPPFEQFLGSYTVSTPASGFSKNYINVVAPTAGVGVVTLDGVPVPAAGFKPIGSTGFSGAQLSVTLGTHTINGGIYPIGAFVYGFDSYDSYGYPGGQSLSQIATVDEIAIALEAGTTAPVGSEFCAVAKASDSFGNPVAGVRVDFTVSGANTASGFAITNANGEATFCYPGTNAGTDTITATSGTFSDSAQLEFVESSKQNQSITFAPIPNKTFGDPPFTISATASSGLPVGFRVVSGPATLSGDTVTLTGAGIVVIEASQPGDSTYNAAYPVTQAFEVNDVNAPELAVQSFTLVNALDEQDLMPLADGDTINLAMLPTRFLNIRANTSQQSGVDVYFELSGKQSYSRNELGAPFALFGDNAGDYKTWLPAAGHYTLTATPSTDGGAKGTPATISFTVVNKATPKVTGFTLVNALDEQDLMPLADGDTINLAALPTRFLNIRANTSQQSGVDVYFELSGKQSYTRNELGAPFALFGDNAGDYKTWLPAAGHYTLTATPSTDGGAKGTPVTISFTVVKTMTASSTSSLQATAEQRASAAAYPNPTSEGRIRVLLPQEVQGELGFSLHSSMGAEVTGGALNLAEPTKELDFDFSRQMSSNGVYFLRLKANGMQTVLKVVRQ